jgi:hypothetical protein
VRGSLYDDDVCGKAEEEEDCGKSEAEEEDEDCGKADEEEEEEKEPMVRGALDEDDVSWRAEEEEEDTSGREVPASWESGTCESGGREGILPESFWYGDVCVRGENGTEDELDDV